VPKNGAFVTNPFDDPDGVFLVLINEELQYSLWPAFADVPPGWVVAREAGTHRDSIAFIEESWTDMRPKSLVDRMAGR
jgi:MbtH protein